MAGIGAEPPIPTGQVLLDQTLTPNRLRIRARAQKVEMADAESRCQRIERHDRRVTSALLQAADILPAEAEDFGELTWQFQSVGFAIRWRNLKQVRGLDAQYVGQLRQNFEARVARTFFEFADIGAVHVGAVRKVLLRYPSAWRRRRRLAANAVVSRRVV